ncbi:MAG: type IV pilus assembly protein PilM [Candidatus Pacebacteria bacterium]|nr:type IV pilus assembly protein PilM [Candidatus Paceibacterota bacterium]
MTKIIDWAKSLLSSEGSDSIVGIDIGSSSIKIVQLKKSGSVAVLETYGTLSLGQFIGKEDGIVTNLETEDLSKALVALLDEAKVDSKDAGITIPALNALLFTLSIPESITGSMLEEAVKNEARSHVPVSITDVNLDWVVIPKRDFDEKVTTNQEVLVVAVLSEPVKKTQAVMSGANLDIKFLEVEFFSMVRSLMTHELSPTMIIDFGAQKTKIAIVEAGIVKQVHIINRGGFDISSAIAISRNIPFARAEELKITYGLEPVAEHAYLKDLILLSTDYIISECKSVVLGYEKKYNRTIHEVILAGGGSRLRGLYELTTDVFQADVVYANPFQKTKSPEFLEDALKTIGPEYAQAIGVALRAIL